MYPIRERVDRVIDLQGAAISEAEGGPYFKALKSNVFPCYIQ
jgi:hypothetical protein